MQMTIPPVIAHRGASAYAPENTLKAFKKAKMLGAAMVEFDVGLSKDNVPVIIHDDTVDRTTNRQGLVCHFTLDELKQLDAGEGEQIPTLEEAMEYLADLNLSANVEIKPCPGLEEKTVDISLSILKKWHQHLPSVIISSFDLSILKLVRENWLDVSLAVLFEDLPSNWQSAIVDLGCVSVNVDQRHLTLELVQQIHQARYQVLSYTVNDAERAAELFSWGVDGVFTNFIDKILTVAH